jgi:hypothetical protein
MSDEPSNKPLQTDESRGRRPRNSQLNAYSLAGDAKRG